MIRLTIKLLILLAIFGFGVVAGYLGWFDWLLDNFNLIKK